MGPHQVVRAGGRGITKARGGDSAGDTGRRTETRCAGGAHHVIPDRLGGARRERRLPGKRGGGPAGDRQGARFGGSRPDRRVERATIARVRNPVAIAVRIDLRREFGSGGSRAVFRLLRARGDHQKRRASGRHNSDRDVKPAYLLGKQIAKQAALGFAATREQGLFHPQTLGEFDAKPNRGGGRIAVIFDLHRDNRPTTAAQEHAGIRLDKGESQSDRPGLVRPDAAARTDHAALVDGRTRAGLCAAGGGRVSRQNRRAVVTEAERESLVRVRAQRAQAWIR